MASIATDVQWGSNPKIYFNFSYSKERSGTTQKYKITTECEALTGSSYFGYPINIQITVNGTLAATKTLKAASQSQWSSALTYTTDWVSVANKTTGTTPIKIRVYSGDGSTRDTTYSYSLDTDPAPSKISATDADIGSVSTVKFTRYNSAYTHTLSYKADGQSSYTTIFSKKDTTSYNWTVPASLCSLITSGKTIGVTLRCQTYNGTTLVGTTYGTMTATAAPSKIGATDANIGSTSTVTFARYNNAFTHTLAYIAAGQTSYTTIFSKQDITSHTWEVPTSLYALIPNDKEIDVTLRCQTYSGSTLIGTEYGTMTATVAEKNCAPSISVTAADSNENTIALTGDNKKIIKFHSDIAVKATATAKTDTSATIKSTTVKCGSITAQGHTKTFTKAESVNITATTTDSRGYSKTAEATGLSLIDYTKLTANTTVKRTSPTGDTVIVTTKGNFFNSSFGAVKNTLTVEVAYKLKGAEDYSEYSAMAFTTSGNTYTATATLTGLDYQQVYSIQVRAQDQIYKFEGPIADAVYNDQDIKKGIPVFDWGENDFQVNVSARFRATADALPDGNANVAIRAGTDSGQHIDIDTNEIIAKDSETALGALGLAATKVNFGDGTTNNTWIESNGNIITKSQIYINNTSDIDGASQGNAPLRIGDKDGGHLDIDANEIIAKASPTTLASNLGLKASVVTLYSTGDNYVLRVAEDTTSAFVQSLPTYNRTYSQTPNMYITSTGAFGRGTSSSQRYKQDIASVTDAALDPHAILNIPVRQYRYKPEHAPLDKSADEIYIGFIAEEVAKAYPPAAEYNENGEVEMWNMKILFPALVAIVQEQQQEIDKLKKAIANGREEEK